MAINLATSAFVPKQTISCCNRQIQKNRCQGFTPLKTSYVSGHNHQAISGNINQMYAL